MLRVIFELSVPYLFNFIYLSSAELEPGTHFSVALGCVRIFLLLSAALFIVQLLLSNVSKLKRDLDDLAHVHSGCLETGWVLEAGVAS